MSEDILLKSLFITYTDILSIDHLKEDRDISLKPFSHLNPLHSSGQNCIFIVGQVSRITCLRAKLGEEAYPQKEVLRKAANRGTSADSQDSISFFLWRAKQILAKQSACL